MAKKNDVDPAMFEDMSEEELKSAIITNLKRIKQLQSDMKTYKASVNENIAEFAARIDVALDALAQVRNEAPVM